MFTVLLSLALCVAGIQAAGTWNYEVGGQYGPANWGDMAEQCNGNSQSPIDIKEGDVTPNANLEFFAFTNYDTTTGISLTIANNGHSVVVNFGGTANIMLTGGSLPGDFKAAQYHFHWGSSSAQGSEHLINNHAYPMELHIVHYNTKYANLGESVSHSDGLAVLGFMFEIQEADNANYADIVSKLAEIQSYKASVAITTFTLDSILPADYQTSGFYRYSGSLTTPTCNEAVTWTVMTETIKISETQMTAFRTLLSSENTPIVDNYRPPQPLNGRAVEASFQPDLHWGYSTEVAPNNWKNYYGSCGGSQQSPIDINKFQAEPTSSFEDWTMTGYDSADGVSLEISNNGHTAKIAFKYNLPSMLLSGGGLPENKYFQVLQCHFHWGSSADMGSEHTVGGKAYPMELHIVHYDTVLGVPDAVTTSKGLAVLGFFFEVSDTDNPNYTDIVTALGNIKNKNDKTDLTAMRLDSLFPSSPSDLKHYYRYDGSLTTPGCYESVTWTVFTKTIKISRDQLEAFRTLLSSEKDSNDQYLPLVNNYRPVQPINTRRVKVSVPKWTYSGSHGPAADKWGDYYPYCEDNTGSRQSPINIDPTTVSLDASLKPFTFTNWKQDYSMELSNNGHAAVVSMKTSGVEISGGGLGGDVYELAQFHFHWGSDSGKGSEHLIDNGAYPMEVHFVHFNKKYGDIGNALKKSDGLAVLGFMFEIGDNDNPAMEPIVSQLSKVINPKEKVDIAVLNAERFLPAEEDRQDYYRYLGSLTTPGCYESVTWTVFRQAIIISEAQMDAFRAMKSSEKDDNNTALPLVDNYRPVMKIHGREIKSTFLIGAGVSTSHSLVVMVISSLVAILLRMV